MVRQEEVLNTLLNSSYLKTSYVMVRLRKKFQPCRLGDKFKNIICYGSAVISCLLFNDGYIFKNIICYGSAGCPHCPHLKLVIFKNIICYGSAMETSKEWADVALFKNIICYGSAKIRLSYHPRTLHLKTSYVMVRRIERGFMLSPVENLKTSYVMVRQHPADITLRRC